MTELTHDDYNHAAVEVALALAHMNWVAMHADAAANIAALSSGTLDQYTDWEQHSTPMKHAALGASYWVARRAMAIMINEFVLSLPDACALLTEHCIITEQALRTALQSPDDERDYGGVVCALIRAIAERQAHDTPETSNFHITQVGPLQ